MGKWRQLTLAPILSGTPSKTTMRSRGSAKHRQMQREENTVDTGLTEEMFTAPQSIGDDKPSNQDEDAENMAK